MGFSIPFISVAFVNADGIENKTYSVVSLNEPILPPSLFRRATVEFREKSLRDFVGWFEKTSGIEIDFDHGCNDDGKISLKQPYSERLMNQPIYLLLDRLSNDGLYWRLDGKSVVISKAYDAEYVSHLYPIQDLLDKGYSQTAISKLVQTHTTGPWIDIDKDGGNAAILENTLLVRQPFQLQREVHHLLNQLKNHDRLDHVGKDNEGKRIREELQQEYSFHFKNQSLTEIIQEISNQTNLDIRILPEIRDDGHDPDSMMESLSFKEQSLANILQMLLYPDNISYEQSNGIIKIGGWIYCPGCAALNAVIHDVSDICRDEIEADDLKQFIFQATSGPWLELDHDWGDIDFPRYQTMIIRTDRYTHQEVGELLEKYRVIHSSNSKLPSDEFITRFYKVERGVAEALEPILWKLIPGAVEEKLFGPPENPGTISLIPSGPRYFDHQGNELNDDVATEQHARLEEQTTMIITHRRHIHRHISKLIERIQSGDRPVGSVVEEVEFQWETEAAVGGGFF